MKKTFKQARKFLDEIPCINLGGCGIAALAMYDAARRDGKKPKIVYLYDSWDWDSKNTNEEFKLGRRKKAVACSHIVLKIGKTYWDSEGKIKEKKIKQWTRDEEITRKHLIASIMNKGDWNSVFDRKRWLPKIAPIFRGGMAALTKF